ncbi:hypothetical protein BGZ65_000295 [Modicella reniformis]|uniref:Uncharacterized protein n=1 Tax=Modicella reniformis TaxID=1440133 RepID=A0A9P6J2K0_9FUNG|nr:hypothetical protein BGZ65_000295 [Modicella reniformis]
MLRKSLVQLNGPWHEGLFSKHCKSSPQVKTLSNRPLNSGQIFEILVRSVFHEYTVFFLRGEEALKEKVPRGAHPPPTPIGAPADTIDNYRALNLMLAPDDQHRFYPQITFEDAYIRMNERGLRDILYVTDTPNIRNAMIRVFGTKDQCQSLTYPLFVEYTEYAKTTMSMHTAAIRYAGSGSSSAVGPSSSSVVGPSSSSAAGPSSSSASGTTG